MSSPLSPILGQFYMCAFEKEVFNFPIQPTSNIVHLYRYVDDILILWKETKRQLDIFLKTVNKLWNNFLLQLGFRIF